MVFDDILDAEQNAKGEKQKKKYKPKSLSWQKFEVKNVSFLVFVSLFFFFNLLLYRHQIVCIEEYLLHLQFSPNQSNWKNYFFFFFIYKFI